MLCVKFVIAVVIIVVYVAVIATAAFVEVDAFVRLLQLLIWLFVILFNSPVLFSLLFRVPSFVIELSHSNFNLEIPNLYLCTPTPTLLLRGP